MIDKNEHRFADFDKNRLLSATVGKDRQSSQKRSK